MFHRAHREFHRAHRVVSPSKFHRAHRVFERPGSTGPTAFACGCGLCHRCSGSGPPSVPCPVIRRRELLLPSSAAPSICATLTATSGYRWYFECPSRPHPSSHRARRVRPFVPPSSPSLHRVRRVRLPNCRWQLTSRQRFQAARPLQFHRALFHRVRLRSTESRGSPAATATGCTFASSVLLYATFLFHRAQTSSSHPQDPPSLLLQLIAATAGDRPFQDLGRYPSLSVLVRAAVLVPPGSPCSTGPTLFHRAHRAFDRATGLECTSQI